MRNRENREGEEHFSAIWGEVENPKSEARNSKQYQMIQIQMTKIMSPSGCLF